MHEDETIRRIAERDGVIGLIMAQHQLNHGIRRRKTKTLDQSLDVICRHIDRIHELTGSHRHVGDRQRPRRVHQADDGRAGAHAARCAPLQAGLGEAYPRDVDAITHGNALRVLRAVWG